MKHHVFSARTTEQGLKTLNQVKLERGLSWDELVVDAIVTHYKLDRKLLALPKIDKPTKTAKPDATKQPKAEEKTEKPAMEVKQVAVIATAETKPTKMPKATAKKVNGKKAEPAKKS
ncbi:hypothetical protein ACFLXL_00240 [Chloroflexota bacterium]